MLGVESSFEIDKYIKISFPALFKISKILTSSNIIEKCKNKTLLIFSSVDWFDYLYLKCKIPPLLSNNRWYTNNYISVRWYS